MGTPVEPRRGLFRYAAPLIALSLVSGSLNMANPEDVLDALAMRNDRSESRLELPAGGLRLHVAHYEEESDPSQRLRNMARNTLALMDAGREVRPAERKRTPDVEPLQFMTAAAMPPMMPQLPASAVTAGKRVASADKQACARGGEAGFAVGGCLLREVAWPLRELEGNAEQETVPPAFSELAGGTQAAGRARSARLNDGTSPKRQ